jgi:hypothetical protein
MQLATMTTFALCAFSRLASAETALPTDPRLDPVHARMNDVVARAEQAGLPTEIIVSKVREGLAKGIDPERIATAVDRLTSSLTEARAFVVQRRQQGATSVQLVRAVAEARMAGVELAANEAIVRSGHTPDVSARAVEVLMDLSLRGYPVDRASRVVMDVLTRDPGAVPRLPATLETIRHEQALTQGESVDALSRGMVQSGGSLRKAAAQAAAAGHRPEGVGRAAGKAGEGGGGPASPGFVPPGLLKRQAGAMKPGAANSAANSAGQGSGPGAVMGQSPAAPGRSN